MNQQQDVKERLEAVETAQEYYNSHDAHTFYATIWGGEDLHIGTFRRPEDTIYDASRRSVDGIASLSYNINNKPNCRVLDLGSGIGGTARHLANRYGCYVVGLNLSEVENERHRRKNREQGFDNMIEVFDGNFEEVPFEDESFDVVWSEDAILHSADRRKVLQEAHRVLKKGGEMVFSDPLQTEDCFEEFLQPILKRLHLKSLATASFYVETAKELGMEVVHHVSQPQQLVNHYGSVLQETKDREDELRAKDVSENYLNHMKTGLENWVKGAKYGHLDWGWFCFRKPEK